MYINQQYPKDPNAIRAIRKKFFIFLGIFSIFIIAGALYSHLVERQRNHQPCLNTMNVYVKLDTNNIPNRLVVLDSIGVVHRPILESENIVLSEGDSLKICYTLIDSTNLNHRLIHINKAFPVNLQDEESD